MRTLAFVVLALFIGVAPASAWDDYKYPDQAVAIQFPAKPTAMKSTYKSILAKDLPSMVYSAELDNVLYRLTVIDLGPNAAKGSSFLNEAGNQLMRQGKVTFWDFPLLIEKSVFGVTLGVDRKDGGRVVSSFYDYQGRLYIPEAVVIPARGDKDMTMPSRFVQTIRFLPDSFN